jgi:hypothetical protein
MKVEVTIEYGANAIDIPTMRSISAAEYTSYVDGDLFYVDHNGILRATLGDYPIAASADQVELLIRHLTVVAKKIRSSE